MVFIEKGIRKYKVDSYKSGQAKDGTPWALIMVAEKPNKSGKVYHRITVWIDNQEDAGIFRKGEAFVVDEINRVTFSSKLGADGVWRDNVSANCIVHRENAPASWDNEPKIVEVSEYGAEDGEIPF